MPEDSEPNDYASIKLTHNATIAERAEALRRRRGRRSTQPECVVIGHAWTEDGTREGGSMCMVCQIVRFP